MRSAQQSLLQGIVRMLCVFGSMSGAAQAALTCSAGASNTVGGFMCTESVTFGPARTDLANAVLVIDKFSSFAAAGFVQTLTGVSWQVSAMLNYTGTVSNPSPSPQSFTIHETTTVTFAPGIGAPASFLLGGLSPIADSGLLSFALAGGGSTAFNSAPNSSKLTGSTANVAGYSGGGTFLALASTTTALSLTGGVGNVSLNTQTVVTPLFELTYTFQTSVVPEVPTFALMLLGLAGIVVCRRRQTVQANGRCVRRDRHQSTGSHGVRLP